MELEKEHLFILCEFLNKKSIIHIIFEYFCYFLEYFLVFFERKNTNIYMKLIEQKWRQALI